MSVTEISILNRIYDAALRPDLWRDVIEDLSELVRADAANLTSWDVSTSTGSMITARVDPSLMDLYFDNYAVLNPRLRHNDLNGIVRPHGAVFTDEEWQPRETYTRSPFYNEYMRRLQADWSLCIRLKGEVRDVSTIVLARGKSRGRYEAGEIDLMRRLQPHLERAYGLTNRLADAGLKQFGVQAALDRAKDAAFILDHTGLLLHANEAGERLLADGEDLSLSQATLTAPQRSGASALSALIGKTASGDPGVRMGGSLKLASSRRRAPLVVTAVPIQNEAPLFTHRAGVLVTVSSPGGCRAPSMARLREVFGLTPAESRVALAIFEGMSPQEIAGRLDLSPNTVRVQLASVFSKTGVHRQAALVRLMIDTA